MMQFDQADEIDQERLHEIMNPIYAIEPKEESQNIVERDICDE